MTPEQWSDTAKLLGVSAPLVGVLIYLLKQATDERQAITSNFLKTMSEIATANAEGPVKLAIELHGIQAALREMREQASGEHREMMAFMRANPLPLGRRAYDPNQEKEER